MEQNLVSVIIPVYNVERYLDACVASVCSQTYQNIEIILVDDGSTDRSSEICEEWAERDDRISVIHKKNGGLSSARNAGLDSAKGAYVLFVDSDDTICNNLLEKTIPHMDIGFETVSFGYKLVFESKEQNICFPAKEYYLETDEQKKDFLIGPFFKFKVGWSAWNRVFRRDYIERYQIRFVDTARIFAEDQHFSLCYLSHCSRIKAISDCLYHYFQRADSIMGTSRRLSQIHVGQNNELAKDVYDTFSKWNDTKHLITVFPIIHYLILERTIQDIENRCDKISDVCKVVQDDIKEKSNGVFFEQNMRHALANKSIFVREYSILGTALKCSRIRALLGKKTLVYSGYFRFNRMRRVSGK